VAALARHLQYTGPLALLSMRLCLHFEPGARRFCPKWIRQHHNALHTTAEVMASELGFFPHATVVLQRAVEPVPVTPHPSSSQGQPSPRLFATPPIPASWEIGSAAAQVGPVRRRLTGKGMNNIFSEMSDAELTAALAATCGDHSQAQA
jgi:hypothetical protein